MTVRLGADIHSVAPRTLVHVPAGTAHCVSNDGAGELWHVEMTIPAPPPTEPIAYLLDSTDDIPVEHRASIPASINIIEAENQRPRQAAEIKGM